MSTKIVLLLSSMLFASAVQVTELGVNIDVPEGWVSAKTDDSTYTVTNDDGSVQYGVTMFSGLLPYDTDSAWVSGTSLGFRILLESEPAVIWSTDSLTSMSGLYTYRVNYETFYQPTGDVLAGQSRFIARGGIGYEIWVIGDTTELYSNFNPYDSLLNLISFFNVASIKNTRLGVQALELQSCGFNVWTISSPVKAVDVKVYSMNGQAIAKQTQETAMGTQVKLYGAPGFAIIQVGSRKQLVQLQ